MNQHVGIVVADAVRVAHRLSGRDELLSEVLIEEVDGEEAAALGHQFAGQVFPHVVQRHALGSCARRLVAEEAAGRRDERVPAVDVVLEEPLESLALGARHAALFVTGGLETVVTRLEVRRGETRLAHQDHRGLDQRAVHSPAAAVTAQRVGDLDHRQRIVGIVQADVGRFLQLLGQPLPQFRARVLEVLQVGHVLGDDQHLERHALDLRRATLETAGDERHLGQRSSWREAERGAARLGRSRGLVPLARTGHEPAFGNVHRQVDLVEVRRVHLGVAATDLGTARG